jgi:hypothetical protein
MLTVTTAKLCSKKYNDLSGPKVIKTTSKAKWFFYAFAKAELPGVLRYTVPR